MVLHHYTWMHIYRSHRHGTGDAILESEQHFALFTPGEHLKWVLWRAQGSWIWVSGTPYMKTYSTELFLYFEVERYLDNISNMYAKNSTFIVCFLMYIWDIDSMNFILGWTIPFKKVKASKKNIDTLCLNIKCILSWSSSCVRFD